MKNCTRGGAILFSGNGGSDLVEQIESLASLQNLDREIQDKGGAKRVLLAEIEMREKEIETKRSDVGILKAELEEQDKVRQEKERTLQEENRKAMDKRMRMNRIKNIKELQALQREIDQIKQGNTQLEGELLSVMETLETKGAAHQQCEAELKELEERWSGKRGEYEAQIAEIERTVSETSKARAEIAAQLSGDLIGRYELIFSRRGGMAVVAVSEEICAGCYMNIPPQLWNEIIRNDKLILCPNCHRILYYKLPAPEDKQV
ncbi:MAG: C4-type zinc ribbon domain-containing protein [Candidatus Binatia bacterium]